MYTVYIPTNTKLHIQWSTYKTTEEFTVYSYSGKKKKKLCCILSSVSVWPHHLIHITSNVFPGQAAGEISPSMVNPAMKSINCYISTRVFHSLEKGYTRLWISVMHFPSPGRKSGSDLIIDYGPWPSLSSSSPSSSSYSHSSGSGSASVSSVGIHCSKTEKLTCCPLC